MPKRVHDIAFAALIGIILGMTILALYARITPSGGPRVSTRPSAVTERMIEEGKLSDHEAKYYKIEDQSNQGVTP